MEIGPYGTLVRQAPWKFLLHMSNKGAIGSNSLHMKFILLKKESIKYPTAMTTPGKPCKYVNMYVRVCVCENYLFFWKEY